MKSRNFLILLGLERIAAKEGNVICLVLRVTFVALTSLLFDAQASEYPKMGEQTQQKILKDFERHSEPPFSLEEWIYPRKGASLFELISELPKDFRTEPIWIYRSRSSQFASPLEPRIILKNGPRQTLLAFETRQSSRPQIEFIQYDGARGEYLFGVVEKSGGQWKIDRSEKTQKFCASCHTVNTTGSIELSSLRPNFSQYNVWEGMFGSRVHLSSGAINEKFIEAEKDLLSQAVREQKTWSELFTYREVSYRPAVPLVSLKNSDLWDRMVRVNEEFTSELHSQTYHRIAKLILKLTNSSDRYSEALNHLVLNYELTDEQLQQLKWDRKEFEAEVDQHLERYIGFSFESATAQRLRNVSFLALELSRLGLSFDWDEQKNFFESKKVNPPYKLDRDRMLDFKYRARLQVFLMRAFGVSLDAYMPVRDYDQVILTSPFEFSIKNTLPLYFKEVLQSQNRCSETF